MTSRLFLAAAALGLAMGSVPAAVAQDLVTPACLTRTYAEFSHAQRLLRSTLVGADKASDLPAGSVRYDQNRTPWTKIADDEWRTLEEGLTDLIMDDGNIDDNAEFPPRVGLLEQKKAATSQDILPGMLQAFRAFQCHTRAVCDAARASQPANSSNPIRVQPLGCIAYDMPRFDACRLSQPVAGMSGAVQQANYGEVKVSACDAAREQLVEYEYQVLLMLATYDASYRTLLQMSGMLQDVLSSFRGSLLTPLWQTVRIMDQFDSISCFNAQCDE